jgi:hypothetical protein
MLLHVPILRWDCHLGTGRGPFLIVESVSFPSTDIEPHMSFSPPNLDGLSFSSGPSGVRFLKALAQTCGFGLSARDSKTSDRIRLYCSRSDYKKGEKTTKTGCQFKLVLHHSEQAGLFSIGAKRCLEHNHDVEIPATSGISEQIRDSVSDLRKCGVDVDRVIEYVHLKTGSILTPFEIASIEDPDVLETVQHVAETDLLMQSVVSTGGSCYSFEVDFEGGRKRAALLTVTQSELDNLRKFGDCVFMDGTAIRNGLGWTTVPITLVDNRRELCSGGVLFAAWEKAVMYNWVMTTLSEIVGQNLLLC